MDLNAILRIGVELGASDIHLKVDQPPMLRTDGVISPLPECPALSEQNLLSARGRDPGDARAAASVPRERRPRPRLHLRRPAALPCHVFRQRGAISFAFRVIPRDVPSFEKLSLPAGVGRLANEHRGLILVTGATGSGKTTTLASMLDHINRTRQSHIVTIEDPIEILHPDRMSIVNQREVGIDTESFGQALRRALRQDPDTILIGELRDAETAQTALQAAESGHLVFSTLHRSTPRDGRPDDRVLPAREAAADPVCPRRRPARCDQPAAPAARRRWTRRRRRGDGDERADRRPDPRGAPRGDRRRGGGRQLLRHADVRTGADRRRPRGTVEREIASNAATNVHDFTSRSITRSRT